jgi:succinate-semialdehyde dehydrogenase/glutarate-semialdehyde dehydrogenase
MMRVSRTALALTHPFLREASFINGEWVKEGKGGAPIPVYDPANGDLLGHVPNCSKAQTDEAVAAAAEAQRGWAKLPPAQRARTLMKWADLMRAHAKELAELMSLECGKPLAEAAGEQAYSTGFIDWYAGEAERIYGDILPSFRHGIRPVVRKRPVGVVGIITPWNFPSAMITRSACGALAAGCSVVVKPSELTPFSATALAQLATEAGVPRGVFNVVTGDAAPVGEALTANFTVRKICFTGSTRVGKLLMAQSVDSVKKIAMELGGNAPFIVFDDADLDLAVAGAMQSKFRNAGQTCICANRLYVHEKIHDEFVSKLNAAIHKLEVGHALKKGVTMGPVITKASADRIGNIILEAKRSGLEILAPPLKLSDAEHRAGQFVAPTVITGSKHSPALTENEIFGPVAPVVKFSTTEEVIRMANDTRAGLAAYYFTKDYKKQWTVAEQLQYGMVGINEGLISHPSAPFGGVKESGLGRDGSKYGIDAFLDICYHLHGGGIDG